MKPRYFAEHIESFFPFLTREGSCKELGHGRKDFFVRANHARAKQH